MLKTRTNLNTKKTIRLSFLMISLEKEIVLDMIRAVCSCDHEFREGYNEVMKSPMYDDQLLQQESSLELDEIQKYNDTKRKEREEMERKKWEKEEAEKPRYIKN